MLIASLPGLFINICRVGNECLAIVLTSAVALSLLDAVRPGAGLTRWAMAGIWLGGALLTKAYALAFLPVLPLAACLAIFRDRTGARRILTGLALALLLSVLLAGWWYWRAWIDTGVLSGEQIDAQSAQMGITDRLRQSSRVNWLAVLDSAAFSHIWVGGWSFLVVRRWMYRLFELLALVSATGLGLFAMRWMNGAWRRQRIGFVGVRVLVLAGIYLMMCAAIAWHSLAVFLARDISTGLGWYLYSVIAVEAVLLAVGLTALFGVERAERLFMGACVAALALDVYTVHFLLLPYYTGGIVHSPSHRLETFPVDRYFQPGAVDRILERLALNDGVSGAAIAGLWAAYVCATLALVCLAVQLCRRRNQKSEINSAERQLYV